MGVREGLLGSGVGVLVREGEGECEALGEWEGMLGAAVLLGSPGVAVGSSEAVREGGWEPVVLCEGQPVALGAVPEGVLPPLPLAPGEALPGALLPLGDPEADAHRLGEGGTMKVAVAQWEAVAGAVPVGGRGVGVRLGAGLAVGGSAQPPLPGSHCLPPRHCAGRLTG